MKIVDIADDVYKELGEPSTISVPSVVFWLRSNIGRLNSALNCSYLVNPSSLEIQNKVDDVATNIKIEEAAVLKKMYIVHYYDMLIRTNLSAASVDSVVEVSSDGMRVRKTSKTEIVRQIGVTKRMEVEELNRMIHFYKTNKAAPRQVAGDDTVRGIYNGIGDDMNNYNRLNY
jgi:hypothetical protein